MKQDQTITHTESVYIIKPEAFRHRKEIRATIRRSGLRIVRSMICLLPEDIVERIYPDLNSDLLDATKHFYSLGPCEMGVVEGEDAVTRLFALAGDSPSPLECAEGTIRRRYGQAKPASYKGVKYYLNGFHRSIDLAEAQCNLDLYCTFSRGPEEV